jgi:hypothetical protein
VDRLQLDGSADAGCKNFIGSHMHQEDVFPAEDTFERSFSLRRYRFNKLNRAVGHGCSVFSIPRC